MISLRIAALTCAAVFMSGCSDLCSNQAVRRVDSPDGRHSAILLERDCGATTSFSTQISVAQVGEQPSGRGNVFIADDNHGAAVTGHWGGPWAEVKWLAPNHILVRYAAKSRIFRQTEKIDGIVVSYEATTP